MVFLFYFCVLINLLIIMLEKLFGFNPKETTVKTEIMAGITTFLTMAYILAVNPNILGETGMDKGALFTTTVLMSALPTIFMALYAKLPLALAPGMGLNAFFAYTVCLIMGYSWQFALTAVFLEGIAFILLTVTNLREKIVEVIPPALKSAISAGIGLYIAFIGLKNAEVIVDNPATLVSLGKLTSGSGLLGIIGIGLTSILLVRNVKGALLIGILATTLIGIPMGITNLDGVFSIPPSIEPIFMKFEWKNVFTAEMATIVFTLLFVDLFDCIGTVIGVTTRANMIDENGKIPNLKKVFMVDSVSTTAGAAMGTSTVAVYVESAAGVNEGGRSGLTAFTTGVCFLLALFFAPFFLAIPAAATAPVLVLVGLMMMSNVWKIDFFDYKESIPAFICMIFMPLAYSISDGILLGHLSYVVINSLSGNRKSLTTGMYVLAAIFLLKFILQ
jgi:AGZA family xanthine/uracil permease-like MFS transporter